MLIKIYDNDRPCLTQLTEPQCFACYFTLFNFLYFLIRDMDKPKFKLSIINETPCLAYARVKVIICIRLVKSNLIALLRR